MDVLLIDVRGDDELVLSPCKAHGEFVADLLRLLWRDLAGGEGLADLVKQNVGGFRALRPVFQLVFALREQHLRRGGGRIATVGGDPLAVVGLCGIHRVCDAVVNCLRWGMFRACVHGNYAGSGQSFYPQSNNL